MSRFAVRRAQFKAVLQSNNSSLDQSRFLRLLAVTSVDALYSFPVTLITSVVALVGNSQRGRPLSAAYDWDEVHLHYWKVGTYSAQLWDRDNLGFALLETRRWSLPVGAIIFFTLFGLTKDCRNSYSLPQWFRSRILRSSAPRDPRNHAFMMQGLPSPAISRVSDQDVEFTDYSPSSMKFANESQYSESNAPDSIAICVHKIVAPD